MNKKLPFSVICVLLVAIIMVGVFSFINYQKDNKIDKLYAASLNFYDKGDYDNAIKAYEEILEIKNVDLVRARVAELKNEKIKVSVITDLFNGFKRINDNIDSATNSSEIKQLLMSIQEQANNFNQLETGTDSEVDQFIDSFKKRPTYQLYLHDYITGDVIQDTNFGIIIETQRFLVRSMMYDFLEDVELPTNIIIE